LGAAGGGGGGGLGGSGSGVAAAFKKNRKGLIFLGYALSSVARPLLAFVGSFGAVAALRVVDGVGKGTKDAPRDALVADSSDTMTRGRAFGFQRLIDTLGSVAGPLAASALLLALSASLPTYRFILLLAAVPGTIALTLIGFGIKEPKHAEKAAPARGRLPASFWIFTAAVTLAMLTKVNDSLFLLRAASLGVPKQWIPALFAGFTLIYALVSYPVGIWSDRIGKPPLMLAGWLTLAAVEFGFSFDVSRGPMLALFAFYGLFFALTEGSARAFIAELVPASARGSAYGVFYTATGIAVIAGGFGIGRIWEAVSPEVAFRLSAAGSLVACLVFALLLGRRGKKLTA